MFGQSQTLFINMKKILQITGGLNIGGLENVAVGYFDMLNGTEYSFDFLVFGSDEGTYEKRLVDAGARVFHVCNPHTDIKKFTKEFLMLLGDNQYDIIHSHVFFMTGYISFLAKSKGVKRIIAHAHSVERVRNKSTIKTVYYSCLRILMLVFSDEYCACSVEAGKYVFGGVFNKKGVVIPNAIDIQSYIFNRNNRCKIREEFGIGEKDIVLGNVGRLDIIKRQDFLIKLMPALQSLYPKLRIYLVIVGDGDYRKVLEELIDERALKDNVLLLGNRQDVNKILSALDVFLFPSLHEGFGIALIEAIANGLTSIVNGKALSEELLEIPACRKIYDFSINNWVNEISRILDKNDLIHKDYTKWIRKYSSKDVCSKLVRLYR